MLVYIYLNLINSKVYVGQTKHTLDWRHKVHMGDARGHSAALFHKALRKYGEKNFVRAVLSYASSQAELDEMEKHFIQKFRANERNTGYNCAPGGLGGGPGRLSPETKEKMRQAHLGKPSAMKGKKHSLATRRNFSQQRKGVKKSLAMRQNLSATRTGLKFSEETRAKLRAAWVKRKERKYGTHSRN
jgi:group I intron endonuclease